VTEPASSGNNLPPILTTKPLDAHSLKFNKSVNLCRQTSPRIRALSSDRTSVLLHKLPPMLTTEPPATWSLKFNKSVDQCRQASPSTKAINP
jgi:hypothetical protein